MTSSSSKKLEIVSRLIEQRIPAETAYRMMGLKGRAQVKDVVINQSQPMIANDETYIADYSHYKPKNTTLKKQ